MEPITWTIKNIVYILKQRQLNEFDGNIAISGDRGNGKSTLANKALHRFDQFNPWKHQVYSRDDVIALLKDQTYGICWDDEAINSGYKRNFQEKGQQELIKILTAYRDNYNIFASAIPNFFSLDKDLRDLYFLHLHVIERGIAVVHMPIQGRLYSQDRWDAKYNARVEESWSKKMIQDPNFKPPYHKLTTFRGYLYFKPQTEQQEKLYKLIKRTKRKPAFETQEKKEVPFTEKIYNAIIKGQLDQNSLMRICYMENKKYSSVVSEMNKKLRDNNVGKTLTQLWEDQNPHSNKNKLKKEIDSLIPTI